MPARRASASGGHVGITTPNPSTARIHRTNESVHVLPNNIPPNAPYNANSTPQQKVVHTLVNRLKNRLPIHSGVNICQVEADDALQQAIETLVDLSHESVDVIAWAIAELLDKFAKTLEVQMQRTPELLQSQLMLLKILCVVLAVRWKDKTKDPNAGQNRLGTMSHTPSMASLPGSPIIPAGTRRGFTKDLPIRSDLWTEPPPLDDNCARYILIVMISYLRQTAPPETSTEPFDNFNFTTSFHDFETTEYPGMPSVVQSDPSFGLGITTESIGMPRSRGKRPPSPVHKHNDPFTPFTALPQHFTHYEKTSQMLYKSTVSLSLMIAKYVGRVLYHLSASNWPMVLEKIKKRIHVLANAPDDGPDMIDLELIAHSLLDRNRLFQILTELSSLLVNMKPEAQLSISIPLRCAIWNWVEHFPEEFQESLKIRGRGDNAPERVYDVLHTKDSEKNSLLWPTLTALMCISSVDRISSEFRLDGTMGPLIGVRGKSSLAAMLNKVVETRSKYTDTAVTCLLDFARGAIRAQDGEPLMYAVDIAHELKRYLMTYKNLRPFWESDEEIDVGIFSDILVVIFRYIPEEESTPIFQKCLDQSQSCAVKMCAVRALTLLSIERHRIPWQRPLTKALDTLSPLVRHAHIMASLMRSDHDGRGTGGKARRRPRARKHTTEKHDDRELLIFSIMTLWRSDLPWHTLATDKLELVDWVPNAMVIWSVGDQNVNLAVARSYRFVQDRVFNENPGTPHFDSAVLWLKLVTPASIIVTSYHLLNSRFDYEAQQMWMGIAYGLMESFTRVSDKEHVLAIQRSPDRVTAFTTLEIACLVSLTSLNINVSLTAAHCLRLIAEVERFPDVPLNENMSEEDRAKRYPIYDQIGDPRVPVVGRVAHQKRLRKLVRLIASPNPVYVAVWEECFTRARLLGDTIKAGKDDSASDEVDLGVAMSHEDRQAQWQNLTLFLAAFGASCAKSDLNPRALTQMVPASYLPDSMCNLRNPDEILTGFLNLLIELLVSDSPFVRNTSRDALGGELSPKLYDRVFKLLYEVIQDITSTGGAPDLDWSETFSNFLEQFISVIRSLIEHVRSVEDFMSVDVMGVLRAFADFLTRFDDPACAPVRMKFCALCDTTLDSLAKVGIRKDAYHRQTTLEMIMGWLQDPSTAVHPQQQFDLNVASLKTLVRLFEKLELKPLDSSGDDPFVFVMRLLGRYHAACFKLLEFTGSVEDLRSDSPLGSYRMRMASKENEIRELIIEGFSRAVNANTEPGLKHCLNYAYDPNLRTRATFARIFARVLLAGTRFDAPGNSSAPPKQSVLCELVKGPDLMLAVAICETCPPDEADFIVPIMLNLFDTRPLLLALLKMLVDREIAGADDSRSLFRGNSTSARLLGAFTKIHGYSYLRSLIQPLIQVMKEMPPGHSYDMDPAKAVGQDIDQNRRNVEIVSTAFLQVVTASIHSLPPMIHELCSHIGKTVNEVWPDAKFPALGAFMFLRFISPAIVSPESIEIELPKENESTMKRGLMIIAKVIQNLANNMFFGKQVHMAPLNEFLKNNIVVVTRFLSDLNKYDTRGEPPDPEEWIGLPYDDTDSIVLHRFFDKHADKVGKELLSLSRPSESDAPAVNGKKAWDNLCAALVDLDSSVPPPQPSQFDSSSLEGYLEFMEMHVDADTSSVAHLFVDSTPDDEDVTVFILFAAKIEADTINMELLVYHVFRTMMDPRRISQPYDIIIDLTGFAAGSQPPVQWLKFITEITPSDLRARKRSIYFLNINSLAHRFLRKIRNLSAGEWYTTETYCPSLAELRESVNPVALEPLIHAAQLEAEEGQEFTDVVLRREQPARIQVTLDVRSTHLRLTTIIPQSVATLTTCKLTEIVSLADISDVYNVSTGQDPDEFIIRKIRHGITLYFSSPMRDGIIKAIRTAKGSMKNVQVAGPERFSRLTNVTATLLQIGMISSIYEEDDLRESGLELLSAICNYLDYEGPAIVPMRGALISRQTSFLVIQLSERLSQHAPQLTLDFLNEVALGMERSTVQQKIHCLQYMSPWVKNLVCFADPTTRFFDQSGARLRDCIRFLISLTLQDEQVYAMVQQYIWSEICKLDSPAVNIVLDELMRTAVDGPFGSRRSEIITDTVGTLSSINVRGRILSKLRKVIGKTTLKPTPTLVENPHWNEIAALTRLALVSTSQCKQAVQVQLFVPEIVHLVTLISSTGAVGIRLSVHGIVMNMLQTLTVGRSGDTPSPEIRTLLDECASPEALRFFGLVQSATTGEYANFDPSSERMFISYQESLTQLLARILEGIAGSKGLLNVWRARWMSLVSSTAFQYSPAVQTRAFITLGTLAVSDVDDDLFYQMIVALKKVLSETKQSDTDLCMILSMLRCFAKLVPSLGFGSRFFPQLFWLGVALLQTGIMGLFIEAAELLKVALENMMLQEMFNERGVSSTLLSERAPMEEISVQLDHMLSLSFDSSFSFSLAAILFKGMRHQSLKEAAGGALRSLLRITTRCKGGEGEMSPNDTVYHDSLGYFLALIPLSTTPESFKKLLEDANTTPEPSKEPKSVLPQMPLTLLGIRDPRTALLSTAFISSVLTTAQIDDIETEIFYRILSDIGDKHPEVIALAYENLHERIKYIFANCTHPDIMSSVSNLFKIAMHQESVRNIHLRGSSSTLSTVGEDENPRRTIGELEDMGMSGLAYTFSFIQPSGDRGNILVWVTQLVDKMIE